MKPMFLIALPLMLATGLAQAGDRGDRIESRWDARGDRIERHLDAVGDRIERRSEHRADWLRAQGHPVQARRVERQGDRIDARLDRRGERIDARLDRVGERREARFDRRHI